jgi:hypothetical protein
MAGHKLTKAVFKKLVTLYMSVGNNREFVEKSMKLYELSLEDAHLIWMSLDAGYKQWFCRDLE